MKIASGIFGYLGAVALSLGTLLPGVGILATILVAIGHLPDEIIINIEFVFLFPFLGLMAIAFLFMGRLLAFLGLAGAAMVSVLGAINLPLNNTLEEWLLNAPLEPLGKLQPLESLLRQELMIGNKNSAMKIGIHFLTSSFCWIEIGLSFLLIAIVIESMNSVVVKRTN